MSLKQEMAAQYPQKENFKVKSGMSSGVSSAQKWRASLLLAILFVVFSAPLVMKLSDGLSRKYLGEKYAVVDNGAPTVFGMVLSALLFMVVVRLFMV